MIQKNISIIVAIAENFAIGKNNDLLFHLPNDLKHFKQITSGHTIIMGRNTLLSLPKWPLPNRRHIIITDKKDDVFKGCETVFSIDEAIEKFSVIKTLQAMAAANVVLLVLDAHQGVSEQDATLAGHVVESGRALVVVINKWDGLHSDERDQVKSELERKLPFLEFAEVHFVSALHGTGVGLLMKAVDAAFKAATSDLKTADLTRILEQAVIQHQPPMAHGRRIKLRYAHQGGRNPPLIVIHGNQTDAVPGTYQRYLVNRFRKAFKLWGTPVRIDFRTGDNPFKGRRNKLTDRQVRKRKRLIKFAKRK